MDSITHFIVQVILPAAGLLFAGGGIGALIAARVQARKAPSEIRVNEAAAEKTEADVTGKYLEIADRAAERALKLDDRVLQLECEVRSLRGENANLRSDHDKLRLDYHKLAEEFDKVLLGAHVLHDQVVEMNGTPKYKPPAGRNRTSGGGGASGGKTKTIPIIPRVAQ